MVLPCLGGGGGGISPTRSDGRATVLKPPSTRGVSFVWVTEFGTVGVVLAVFVVEEGSVVKDVVGCLGLGGGGGGIPGGGPAGNGMLTGLL